MSSVEIKVMTVVMTKKVTFYNRLCDLSSMSSMSSLKKHIHICSTNISCIYCPYFGMKRHISIIYICCYFSDDIDDSDDNHSNPLFSNYNQVSSLIFFRICE